MSWGLQMFLGGMRMSHRGCSCPGGMQMSQGWDAHVSGGMQMSQEGGCKARRGGAHAHGRYEAAGRVQAAERACGAA